MTKTIQELEAEVARRKAEQEAEAQRKAAVVEEARAIYDRDILDRCEALDKRLQDEGQEYQEKARKCLHDMDLNGAFEEFTRWKATRVARADIRNQAAAAAARLNFTGRTLPGLRDVLETFGEWLQRETSGHNRPDRTLGVDMVDALIGEPPLSFEEATAYLAANRGN